jgi:hypothetical protein
VTAAAAPEEHERRHGEEKRSAHDPDAATRAVNET